MSWVLSKRATFAAILLLIFLAINFNVSLRSINSLTETQDQVLHTHQVLITMSDLLSTVKDAETGQRGYVITGDEAYLTPYHDAVAHIHTAYAALKNYVSGNPDQAGLALKLQGPIDAKLAELEETILLYKRDGFEATRKVIDTDRGKNLMDQIRAIVGEMQTREQTERDQRIAESASSRKNALLTFALASVVSLALLLVAIATVQRDMLNRKRALEVLDAQKEQLTVTLSSIGDGVIVTNTRGNVISMNPIAQNLTGWKPDDAIGKSLDEVFNIVNESTRQTVENPANRALKEGVIVGLANHTILISRDGTERPIDDSAAPIRNKQGSVIGVVLVFRDVTERKRWERELQRAHDDLEVRVSERTRELTESEEQLRLTINAVQDYAIFTLDPRGNVRSWNRGAERIKGYTADEIVGKHFSTFFEPQDVEAGNPARELAVATAEGRCEYEGWRVRKDGSRFWANVILTALRDGSNKLRGFTKITRDLTESRKAEEQRATLIREQISRKEAEKATRVKDEFLAVVSHELRTPLTPILGWTKLIKGENITPNDLSKALDIIERNVNTQMRLVEDLLDVSRIISGKVAIDFRLVGPAQVIEAAMEVVRPTAAAKNISMKFIMEESVGPIRGDPARLQQVVWNLLSNAVKFTPRNGSVTITLRRDQSSAVIDVTDSGIGIDSTYLPYIFDRFSQADSAITRRFGGLGIGLSIAKHLVEAHGGIISASSEGKDKGATLSVRLPIPAVAMEAPDPENYPSKAIAHLGDSLNAKRILVVDDEPDAREFLSYALRKCGAETVMAGSVSDALNLLNSGSFDIVVSDIGMPIDDGYSLIKMMRQKGIKTPAVAVTAYARAEDKIRALQEGFSQHIAKPVNPVELCKIVSDIARTAGG